MKLWRPTGRLKSALGKILLSRFNLVRDGPWRRCHLRFTRRVGRCLACGPVFIRWTKESK